MKRSLIALTAISLVLLFFTTVKAKCVSTGESFELLVHNNTDVKKQFRIVSYDHCVYVDHPRNRILYPFPVERAIGDASSQTIHIVSGFWTPGRYAVEWCDYDDQKAVNGYQMKFVVQPGTTIVVLTPYRVFTI
jgi:hypothetical protein